MLIVELTQAQLQNLSAFLDRVTLTGLKEVGAMTSIVTALTNARQKPKAEKPAEETNQEGA